LSTRKLHLKNDAKHLGRAFTRVYPMAFRRISHHWLIALIAMTAIILSFVFDDTVRPVIKGLAYSPLDAAFAFGRWYGNGLPTLYVFLGLYIAGLIFMREKLRETGLLVLEAYIFSGFLTLLFKSIFGRLRPYMELGAYQFHGWSWSNNDQFSFFSGHASVSFALSTILASTTKNIYLKAFYYSLAIITCISRIYHSQHWLSDVVTGAIVAYTVSRVLVAIHNEPKADI
jgi:membrane-associated phospholipid phosphatase